MLSTSCVPITLSVMLEDSEMKKHLQMLYLGMGRVKVGWEFDKYSNDSALGRVN